MIALSIGWAPLVAAVLQGVLAIAGVVVALVLLAGLTQAAWARRRSAH